MFREVPQSAAGVGCAFWDAHHHISEDPGFWMALPNCRRAINRRVSGQEQVYPLDHLYAAAGSPRFGRVLSLGCGTGRLERAIARLGLAGHIDAVDGSHVSLGIAMAKAAEEGLTTISYREGDLNQIRLPHSTYDAAVFHQSLHHVTSVEKLLGRVMLSLKRNGLLFLEEWTGPSRFEWNAERLANASARFATLPEGWRRWPDCRPPIEMADPSEAVRSSAILPTVHRLFSVVEEKGYGGQLVALLLPQLTRENLSQSDLDRVIAAWLEEEDEDLKRNPSSGFYTALLAKRRKGFGLLVGLAANLIVRCRLALRYRLLGVRIAGSAA